MLKKLRKKSLNFIGSFYEWIECKKASYNRKVCYENMLKASCLIAFLIIYTRAFFGTEITDEAYYVSNAITILHGNLPFAYNNEAMTFGSYFLLIPQLVIYEIIVPSLKGVFLFSRLSFVTFKAFILFIVYKVLSKHFQKKNILLAILILIPYSNGIANYGYNAVPFFLMLLSSVLIYEAIEYKSKKSYLYVFLSGFLASWAFFAHCAYAVAIIVFIGIIIWRTDNKEKISNLVIYGAGGILEVIVVFVPIIVQSGIKTFYEGIIRYIKPFPTQKMTDSTWVDRVICIANIVKQYLLFFIVIFIVIFTFFFISMKVRKRIFNVKECMLTSIDSAYIACICMIVKKNDFSVWINHIGIISTIVIILFFFMQLFLKMDALIIYISYYPVLIAGTLILLTGSNDPVTRFGIVISAVFGIVLIALEEKTKIVRYIASVIAVLCLIIIGYAQCKYVYRDAPLSMLKYRVNDGVYYGIYTIEQRAKDLPEIEKYLNSIVGEDEWYAFRDNVPFAYLMCSKGKMCDLNTWDCLQYTYNWNIPARLFAYYKRVNAIPDKIIYIDFGRDDKLSIDDSSYRYNDFVSTYYSLKEKCSLNDTFYNIKVYEKATDFDGDYDYWINTYYDVP